MIFSTLFIVGLAAATALVYVGMFDREQEQLRRNGAQPLPSARQLRRWRRERLVLAVGNRRRP